MMIKSPQQRGSAILYAVLAMTVMLTISLTLSGVFISRLRSSASAGNSMIALYAADSASQMCLYDARHNAPDLLTMTNGATFQVASISASNPDITANCKILGQGSFGFRATGTFHAVRRTLEVSQ